MTPSLTAQTASPLPSTPTALMPSWPGGEMLATTPKARYSVEEQLSDGSARAVVRWRYPWGDGHVRSVQARNGKLAESLADTPLATEQLYVCGSRDRDTALDDRAEWRAGARLSRDGFAISAPQQTRGRPTCSGPA
jgi:hypothetical protein